MSGQVDTFFAFLDKHFTKVMLALAAVVAFVLVKRNLPTQDERATQQQQADRDSATARLVPPAPPTADADGKVNEAKQAAYNAQLKAHRSVLYATQLREAMDGFGTDEGAIFNIGISVALARIPLTMLQRDYLAIQDGNFMLGSVTHFGKKTDLLDDLKSELSTADFLKFMHSIGLTAEQAAAELKKAR